jgi:hypothetical protein
VNCAWRHRVFVSASLRNTDHALGKFADGSQRDATRSVVIAPSSLAAKSLPANASVPSN